MQQAISTFGQLVQRVQTGDDSAMTELMEEYSEPLRRTAAQLIGKALRSQLDSADLVQSVQIILWLGLRTGKFSVATPDNLLALARTLLRRKVARYWRTVKAPVTTISDVSLIDTVVDQAIFPLRQEPSPEESSEFDDLVEHFLEHLGDLDRRLVKLRFQGFSTADAARQLKLDPGFLRVRLGRLRKRFAEFRSVIANSAAQETISEATLAKS
jgi:RNA polymerase sigma-70 factor (ECF subfamily)